MPCCSVRVGSCPDLVQHLLFMVATFLLKGGPRSLFVMWAIGLLSPSVAVSCCLLDRETDSTLKTNRDMHGNGKTYGKDSFHSYLVDFGNGGAALPQARVILPLQPVLAAPCQSAPAYKSGSWSLSTSLTCCSARGL